MAWTEPDLNDFLPGEPYTSAKALLQVENPIAIAEGASGAPRIANSVGSGGTTATYTFSGGYAGGVISVTAAALGDLAETATVTIAFSDDGGSTFSTATTLFTSTPGGGVSEAVSGTIHVDIGTGLVTYSIGGVSASAASFGTVTPALPAGDIDAVRITASKGGSFLIRNGGTAVS